LSCVCIREKTYFVPCIYFGDPFMFVTVLILTEISTMAGRRLRDAVKTILSSHKDFENVHIVITSLSNAYSQYATTYEEYEVQRYEVSCTRHKPWNNYF
jgi:neutral ceramidase